MMRHHVIVKYLELITSPCTPLSSLLVDPKNSPLMAAVIQNTNAIAVMDIVTAVSIMCV